MDCLICKLLIVLSISCCSATQNNKRPPMIKSGSEIPGPATVDDVRQVCILLSVDIIIFQVRGFNKTSPTSSTAPPAPLQAEPTSAPICLCVFMKEISWFWSELCGGLFLFGLLFFFYSFDMWRWDAAPYWTFRYSTMLWSIQENVFKDDRTSNTSLCLVKYKIPVD